MNSDCEETERLPCCGLPVVLVEEILLKLPVNSLVRFKRVCKSWRALINDPSFANRHLEATVDNAKNSAFISLLVLLDYREYPLRTEDYNSTRAFHFRRALLRVNVCSRGSGNCDDLPCVTCELDLPHRLKEMMVVQRFVNSVQVSHSNGIVCIVDFDSLPESRVALCNPAINEFMFLPTFSHGLKVKGQGFGYDSRADDYKFVWICKDEAHLYSLRSDSWKEIKIDVSSKIHILNKNGVYCRGVYYWRNFSLEASKQSILAFDVSKEEFRSIAIPDAAGNHNGGRLLTKLAVWKESIVYFKAIDDPQHFTFEMWVMVDKFGGVEGETCWIKHLTIGPVKEFDYPLEFWKDDELFVRGVHGGILSYNLDTKKIRAFPIDLTVSPIKHHVTSYTESLVSVKRGNMANR